MRLPDIPPKLDFERHINEMASWRNGYAEDCKSLHPGSIPGEASTLSSPSDIDPSGDPDHGEPAGVILCLSSPALVKVSLPKRAVLTASRPE